MPQIRLRRNVRNGGKANSVIRPCCLGCVSWSLFPHFTEHDCTCNGCGPVNVVCCVFFTMYRYMCLITAAGLCTVLAPWNTTPCNARAAWSCPHYLGHMGYDFRGQDGTVTVVVVQAQEITKLSCIQISVKTCPSHFSVIITPNFSWFYCDSSCVTLQCTSIGVNSLLIYMYVASAWWKGTGLVDEIADLDGCRNTDDVSCKILWTA